MFIFLLFFVLDIYIPVYVYRKPDIKDNAVIMQRHGYIATESIYNVT